MDILTVLQYFEFEVKHIPGLTNSVPDGFSRCPDFRQEWCQAMAPDLTTAGDWMEDMKVGIINDEWFGSMEHSLDDRSPRLLPSTAYAKKTQIMGVSSTILVGREWPTVVTWRFGKKTGGERCKGKEE